MEYYNTDFMALNPAPITELPPPAQPEQTEQEPESRFWRLLRGQCVAALVICALLLSMEFWWPAGAQTARKWLVCQEVGPLEAAAQVFVPEVTQGTPVPDAIATFCQELLDGATVPVIGDGEN